MRQPPIPRRVTIVRYQLPDGSRCAKDTPGAVRVAEASESYYVHLGGKRHALGTSDLTEAHHKLRKLQQRLADEAAGIRDHTTDQAARPLADHIAEWIESLTNAGVGDDQTGRLKSRVSYLAELAGWKRLGDVTANSCLAALAELQRAGHGAQTRNHYLTHIKQFVHWCLRPPRRLREDPLAGLRKVNIEADRRHERRAPTEAEINQLMAYLASDGAAVRYGMTGPQRALGYRLCMATGFRAGELRSLNRGDFDLDAGMVTCQAAYSKHRRLDTQPIPAWLAAELRDWFEGGGGCWQGFPRAGPGRKVLMPDLLAAGVPPAIDGPAGPLFFDFHSFRHYYVTLLANQPGISPKSLMALARHSTPALTLSVYAKCRISDLRAAVDQLPGPTPAPRPRRKKS